MEVTNKNYTGLICNEEYIVKTHNGIFHSDEIFAIALIEKYLVENICNFKIIRTRDSSVKANITIDVDGVYNPSELKFDHHQASYNGDKSSVGMIAEWLSEEFNIEFNTRTLDFIKELDANDTGSKKSNSYIVKTIQELNSPEPFSNKQNNNFSVALYYAKEVLSDLMYNNIEDNITNDMLGYYHKVMPLACGSYENIESPVLKTIRINNRLKASLETKKKEAIKNASIKDECITFSKGDTFVPVKDLIGLAHISKQWDSNQQCWSIQTIPTTKDSFGSKYKLEPVGDEIFIHKNGFISKTKSGQYKVVLV